MNKRSFVPGDMFYLREGRPWLHPRTSKDRHPRVQRFYAQAVLIVAIERIEPDGPSTYQVTLLADDGRLGYYVEDVLQHYIDEHDALRVPR